MVPVEKKSEAVAQEERTSCYTEQLACMCFQVCMCDLSEQYMLNDGSDSVVYIIVLLEKL